MPDDDSAGGAPPYFVDDNPATGNHGVRYGRWSFLFTMASMVIVVNSVVVGIASGLGLLALALYYQHLRLTPVVLTSPRPPAGPGA